MMNVTDKVRQIVIAFETDRVFTYDDVYKKLPAKYITSSTRSNLRTIIFRLQVEKIISRIQDGLFKKIEVDKKLLFVYGSLKKGFVNNKVLEGAVYKGAATTKAKFGMFASDTGNFPRLVKTRSKNARNIHGELYEIYSLELIEKIDKFEGINYTREHIKVLTNTDDMREAEVYISTNIYEVNGRELLDKWNGRTRVKINKKQGVTRMRAFMESQREKLEKA